MSLTVRADWVRLACLLEAAARKPGNVHRTRDFADASFVDFACGGVVLGSALSDPLPHVGALILGMTRASSGIVTHNTHLGTILLLAPLVQVPPGADLRAELRRVLNGLTVEDAALAYEAIRLARPGGLGAVADQDIAAAPSVTLTEAMRLASDRDMIARQYVNHYTQVFECGLPALRAELVEGRPLEAAIVRLHLGLLAAFPDSLIARKCGEPAAVEASRRARAVLLAGWPARPGSNREFAEFDAWLRADGHRRNPGTTADLVTATLYVALYDGTIGLPRDWRHDFALDQTAFRASLA